MAEYQLEIKQLVDYPRCRIYRQFVQSLLGDPNIRVSGGSGLFHYTVLSCYANFRTSYRRVGGVNYTIFPGEWLSTMSELISLLRVRSKKQAITVLADLQSRHLTYSFYCVDKAGNQSSTVTITLDKTKPVGTLYAGSSTATSGSRTNASSIKFTATDAIGLNTIYVKKPGATSYAAYTSGTTLTAEGTYSFYAVDKAGNQSDTYTITVDRQIPTAQLYVDGKAVSSGTYTNGDYIKFVCGETCYVKEPGATSFKAYTSGAELNKPGKYVFYGQDAAGNKTSEYSIVIDRTIKQVSVSNVTGGSTNGDVKITWTNGDANSFAPIKSVTVNGKSVSNGTTVHTIDTGNYVVKVVDAAGNEWQTSFKSTKKNVLTDTLVKEYFEATDINGDPFAFTTYEKALEFATARENTKVKTAVWNNSTWDTGVPMDTVDAANAKNGTYFIYYKSGNPDELVAYFTTERLNEVIAEYAKDGIKDYYYWEKEPATAGPNENLYSYSVNRNILAKEVMLGENIGVTVDGEVFVGSVYNTEGKHVMVVSDSYGNTCEYNLTVIRTLPIFSMRLARVKQLRLTLSVPTTSRTKSTFPSPMRLTKWLCSTSMTRTAS